jgi:dihydroorotase
MTNQTFTKLSEHRGKTAYINARVMDPATGLDAQGGVLVENGVIADVGEGLFRDSTPEGANIVDCKGHLLCPGLIDIQVHFREPGQEYKETIETGTKSAAAGGVTSVSTMPNTTPVVDDVAVLEYILKTAREKGYARIYPYACVSKGMEGTNLTEMGLLQEAGAVAFTDDGLPVMDAQLMRQALTYARELGTPLGQHAEDLNLSGGGCMNEGAVSSKLGLKGIPNASEAVIVERDIELVRLTKGKYHVLHISTAEAIEAVRRAKEEGLPVTAEAAPHHFTLTDEACLEYKTFAKMNPPLRSAIDRDAVLQGLKDGTIDAIATDHAPHDQESKRVPFQNAAFGIVGLETMLPLSLDLYHRGFMPLIDVIGRMTSDPARVLNLPVGKLAKGAPADLVLIDVDTAWNIEPKKFASKSKNSPFDDWATKGRAIRTIVGGHEVYHLESKAKQAAA